MSLAEKAVLAEVPKLTDEQLLDIKAYGYHSDEYKALEERTGAKYYRTFILGRVAEQLIERDLMSTGFELDCWWEQYTGY